MDKNKVKAAIYTALLTVATILLFLFIINFTLPAVIILTIGVLGGVVYLVYLIYLRILEHLDDKDINL